jgi:hypothetical protein
MPAARKPKRDSDEMRSEYDFSGAVRGKYVTSFARGSNVVVLASDVAAAFKTSKEVNEALRAYLRAKPPRSPRRAHG